MRSPSSIFIPAQPTPAIPAIPEIPVFELGKLVATPAAIAILNKSTNNAFDIIRRHAATDWGDLCASDVRTNEQALVSGARLLSAYIVNVDGAEIRLWIITEAIGEDGHRASTCILTPEDY